MRRDDPEADDRAARFAWKEGDIRLLTPEESAELDANIRKIKGLYYAPDEETES